MSQFAAFWMRLVLKNGDLGDEDKKMTISVGQFKKFMRKAYEAGDLNARAGGPSSSEKSDGGIMDILGGLFGGGK